MGHNYPHFLTVHSCPHKSANFISSTLALSSNIGEKTYNMGNLLSSSVGKGVQGFLEPPLKLATKTLN